MTQQLTAEMVKELAAVEQSSGKVWPWKLHLVWGRFHPDLITAVPAMAHLIETQAAELASMAWRSMRSAPKDGTAVLALMDGSDVPHAVFYGTGGKGRGAVCWRMKWDHSVIADHDGPLYWMPCPADPRDAPSRAALKEKGE